MRQGTLTAEGVASLEALYRRDGRRIFATLVRLLGSFQLAEEAEHDAFIAAAEQWPRDGVPANPVAWLVSVGRFKAIHRLRRDARFASIEDHGDMIEQIADPAGERSEQETIADDREGGLPTPCRLARNAAGAAPGCALRRRRTPLPQAVPAGRTGPGLSRNEIGD